MKTLTSKEITVAARRMRQQAEKEEKRRIRHAQYERGIIVRAIQTAWRALEPDLSAFDMVPFTDRVEAVLRDDFIESNGKNLHAAVLLRRRPRKEQEQLARLALALHDEKTKTV